MDSVQHESRHQLSEPLLQEGIETNDIIVPSDTLEISTSSVPVGAAGRTGQRAAHATYTLVGAVLFVVSVFGITLIVWNQHKHAAAAGARGQQGTSDEVFVIDADVGIDDIMAISLLLSANVPIGGISIVNGLAHVPTGTKNVLRLLEKIGRSDTIPVVAGEAAPLVSGHTFPESWRLQAEDLPGFDLPNTTAATPLAVPAPVWLHDYVISHAGQVTLVCLGPLTNIARIMAMPEADTFARSLRRVIILGGAVNVSSLHMHNDVAEWNMWIDPEAGQRVIHDLDVPTLLIGMDALRYAACDTSILSRVDAVPSPPPPRLWIQLGARLVCAWKDNFLFDPVAAAYLVNMDAGLLTTARLPVAVITNLGNTSAHDAGRTVIDPVRGRMIDVAVGLNRERFIASLVTAIRGPSAPQ